MITACPECGVVQSIAPLPSRAAAACRRCETTLERTAGRSAGAALALSVAALLLFIPGNVLPVMRSNLLGSSMDARVVDSVFAFVLDGRPLVAAFLAIFVIAVPLLRAALLIGAAGRAAARLAPAPAEAASGAAVPLRGEPAPLVDARGLRAGGRRDVQPRRRAARRRGAAGWLVLRRRGILPADRRDMPRPAPDLAGDPAGRAGAGGRADLWMRQLRTRAAGRARGRPLPAMRQAVGPAKAAGARAHRRPDGRRGAAALPRLFPADDPDRSAERLCRAHRTRRRLAALRARVLVSRRAGLRGSASAYRW